MNPLVNEDQLLRAAMSARERAYAPYSRYTVGAALLAKSGRIHIACNVENASYGLTVCAERAAIFKAVSEGDREFIGLAVVTANGATPCGACRQVLSEFAASDAVLVVSDATGKARKTYKIGDLLPDGFGPRQLPGS